MNSPKKTMEDRTTVRAIWLRRKENVKRKLYKKLF